MVLEQDSIFPTAQTGADEFFISEADASLRPRIVIKSANQTNTGTTTLANDTELFMSVSADSVYEFELTFQADEETGGDEDMHSQFSFPTGATGKQELVAEAGSLATTFICASLDADLRIEINQADGWQRIRGYVKTGNTAGNLQWRWAKADADTYDLVVYAGAWLKVTKK